MCINIIINTNERYKYYFDGGGTLIIILFPLVELFYRALNTLASSVLKEVKVSLVLNCFILSIYDRCLVLKSVATFTRRST